MSEDLGGALRALLEPLREELAQAQELIDDNRRYLEEKQARGIDHETKDLFRRAAESPNAPESLKKIAREVEEGHTTWEDVFARRSGELGQAFLHDAFTTARLHFEDADLATVEPPREALDQGIDPAEVERDVRATLEGEPTDEVAEFWRREEQE